jgi:hypothetical protein
MVTWRVWQRQGYTQAQRLSSDIKQFRVPTLLSWGKATSRRSLQARSISDAAESKAWSMCGNFKRENREIPSVPRLRGRGRLVNLTEGTANMNAGGKSDDFVVPSTRANKAATAVAESAEERKSPKGSVVDPPPMFRTLCRIQHHWERHDGHGG